MQWTSKSSSFQILHSFHCTLNFLKQHKNTFPNVLLNLFWFPIHETFWIIQALFSRMHYPGFAASILLFLSGQQQHQANKRGRPSRSSPAQGQQPQTPHLSYVRVGGGKIQRIFHWYSNLQRSESIDITTARLHACPQNSCGSAGGALVQLKVFMKGKVSALFHGNSSSLFMKPFE